jgi:DNA-binding LytR/AlgR family response regulator
MQSNPAPDFAFRPVASGAAPRLVRKPARLHGPPDPRSTRIAIKNQGRIQFIDPGEVFAIVAQGNYVLLQREAGAYCLRESISAMAEKMEAYGFVRIHRSALVNRSWVEEVSPHLAGECLLRLRGGREFKVTRTYKRNLKSLAELWLGNDACLGR